MAVEVRQASIQHRPDLIDAVGELKAAILDMHHRLVLFGRYTCQARAPRCGECPCAVFCPSRVG
jgi:endonuclease III